MKKTKFIMVFLAVLVFAGSAISQDNVDQAVRVRLTKSAAYTSPVASPSPIHEVTVLPGQQFILRSISQIEALGSQYAWGRSASQVEALGSQYAWGRSASQVEALGSQYAWGRSASQVEALGSQYAFGR